MQNTAYLPFSRPAGGREDRGSGELGWQQGATRCRVKTGQHQHSVEEIQHGRLRGLAQAQLLKHYARECKERRRFNRWIIYRLYPDEQACGHIRHNS